MKFMKKNAIVLITFLSLQAFSQSSGPTQKELDNALRDDRNWLYVDHDYHGTRFSGLSEINVGNVARLEAICSYTFPDKEPSQTAPLVYDGIIYATTAHYTVALDGASCKVIWQYRWKPRSREVVMTQRGAAIKDGKVVRGTADGYLLALDAKTGTELWSRQIADPAEGYFFSVAPLIVDDYIFIGPAGSEWAGKCWVGAFKLSNGERVWKFNTVPDLAEAGAATWGNNPKGLKTGGGSVWTPMSYDPEKKLLYVPVGNPAPDFYDKDRPGDNLYTSSIVALDIASGKLAWYYQTNPHDQRDYDLTHVSPVFRVKNSTGRSQTLIALTGKDGLLRVIDRDTHRLVYSAPFTTRLNNEGLIGRDLVHICPAMNGGHEWNGSTYHPKLNILFVPATDWCGDVRMSDKAPEPQEDNTKGPYFFGGDGSFLPWSETSGWLRAFDAASGKELWKYHAPKPMIGGVISTAGELVFTGEVDGTFEAFRATTGEVLYKHQVGGPIGGGVVSYMAAGMQRVAVVSGFVGLYNIIAPELGGANTTITVFGLK